MREWLLRAGLALILAMPARSEGMSVLGPPETVSALQADPDGIYGFIVRGDPASVAAAGKLAAADAKIGPATALPLIDGVALALRSSTADQLSRRRGVTQVWYIPRPLFAQYVHVIESLQYLAKTTHPPVPINLSLGPPADLMPMPMHADEPMNAATRKMADLGDIPVFASGNYYTPSDPDPGVINPWCAPDWVICVGAAKPDLSGLWDGSARGKADDPTTWPDMVADGVDVLGPWPKTLPKSIAQRQHDESNAYFKATIPKEKWDEYSLQDGTSEATAMITRAVAQLVYFVQQTIVANKDAKTGGKLFTLLIPNDHFAATSRAGARLTGDVGPASAAGVEVTYRWVAPWRLVKQLLIDTAVPMKGQAPADVGAGYISPAYIEEQFGKFGIAHPVIEPIKALP